MAKAKITAVVEENDLDNNEDDGSIQTEEETSFERLKALTTFETQMVQKCKNILEYKDRDVLEIEVNNFAANGVIFEWGTLKHGKSTIEILGKHLTHFLTKVAAIEDVKQLRQYIVQHGRKRALEAKRLQDTLNNSAGFHSNGEPRSTYTQEDLEMKLADWDSANNPYKSFRENHGYAIPPIRHMKMIDNKGPRSDDAVANEETNKNIQSQLAEAHLQAAEDRRAMMKLMETNAKLMEKLLLSK